MKKTSVTGFLRMSHEVNKRAQDTAKEYWLCDDCEDRFSLWEGKFASRIFYPFVEEGKSTASYEHWMSKFCASLTWRTLTYIRSINPDDEKPKEYYETIEKAEKHLANYLLDKVDNLNEYEQHLFPLEAVASTSYSGLPKNINRYLLRSIAMDIVGNNTELLIYTKLPSFMLLGFVKVNEPRRMRSSRIALKAGKISPREYYWPDGFINYLTEKAEAISDAYDKIPKEQLDKIDEFLMNNPEKAANSKTFEAFLHDHDMFGKDVFR